MADAARKIPASKANRVLRQFPEKSHGLSMATLVHDLATGRYLQEQAPVLIVEPCGTYRTPAAIPFLKIQIQKRRVVIWLSHLDTSTKRSFPCTRVHFPSKTPCPVHPSRISIRSANGTSTNGYLRVLWAIVRAILDGHFWILTAGNRHPVYRRYGWRGLLHQPNTSAIPGAGIIPQDANH